MATIGLGLGPLGYRIARCRGAALRVRTVAVLLALVLPFSAACNSGDTARREIDALRIGVLPDQNAEMLQQRYTPLFEYLASELEIPYQYIASRSYEELVEQFVAGRVDLAYFGGLTFLQAHSAGQAEPLVMRDVDAKFISCFLVRSDSPATEVRDFQGKVFSFGSEMSTSGHLMPRHFLLQRGIRPEDLFAEVRYSGAHDRTAYEVRDGRVDLGVADCHVIRSMFADGRLRRDELRVLWETPPYPDHVWAVQPDLDHTQRRAARDAFMKLSPADDDHLGILGRMSAGAFLPASIEDFAGLRVTAIQLSLLFEKR
jgi:phosphonate transport system substrate-binding protein